MASSETVLVTGAGGFIGSHLVEALVREGRRGAGLRALQRPRRRRAAPLPPARASAGRSRSSSATSATRTPSRTPPAASDVIYHLGALIGIPYSYVHPRETVDTNVTGTLNVLLAARERGVRRVVHTSTSEVYGTARTVPITEEHPLQGQSPYSASKIGADMLAESFHRAFGVPVVTIRPFNTYGPAAVDAGGDPDDRGPGAAGRRGAARLAHPDPRPQLRHGHRGRLRTGGACDRGRGSPHEPGPRRGDDGRRPRREDRRHGRPVGPDRDRRGPPAAGGERGAAPARRQLPGPRAPRLGAGGRRSTRASAGPSPGCARTSTPTRATGTRCSP